MTEDSALFARFTRALSVDSALADWAHEALSVRKRLHVGTNPAQCRSHGRPPVRSALAVWSKCVDLLS